MAPSIDAKRSVSLTVWSSLTCDVGLKVYIKSGYVGRRRLFERAFEDDLRICWLLYQDEGRHCAVRDYLAQRPKNDTAKILARMKEFARNGDWNARVGFIKRLVLADSLNHFPILEVKSHQDRILFFRREMSAVAFGALQKKDDWSKKDQRTLAAAVQVAVAANKELGGVR